jgi:hypothetical protein
MFARLVKHSQTKLLAIQGSTVHFNTYCVCVCACVRARLAAETTKL